MHALNGASFENKTWSFFAVLAILFNLIITRTGLRISAYQRVQDIHSIILYLHEKDAKDKLYKFPAVLSHSSHFVYAFTGFPSFIF